MIPHAQLQVIRSLLAANIADAYSVGPHLRDRRLTDIHINIGCHIVCGIQYFIKELLLTALLADHTAAVRRFRDLKGILCDLRDRESQFIHSRYAAPVIHVIAACSLSATL